MLLYQLKWGKHEANIIRDCQRTGKRLPDEIENAPELMPGMEMFAKAFRELGTCRQIGMSVGPIPWTAINDYCERCNIEGELAADMFYVIRAADDAYLEWVAKEQEKTMKKPASRKQAARRHIRGS